MAIADETFSEVYESFVDVGAAVVPGAKTSKAVKPPQGTLGNPAEDSEATKNVANAGVIPAWAASY